MIRNIFINLGRAISIRRVSQSGFTLVELIVVIIIVGVLAAVAIPVMQKNAESAIKAEAIAAMGSLRTGVKLYLLEYPDNPIPSFGGGGNPNAFTAIGLSARDLLGTYYSAHCYQVGDYLTGPDKLAITCTVNYSEAAKRTTARNTHDNIIMRVSDGAITEEIDEY